MSRLSFNTDENIKKLLEIDYVYKGYVRSRGKIPSCKWKNPENMLELECVANEPSFLGVLRKRFTMVDVDDKKQSEALYNMIKDEELNAIIFKSTKGAHFIFKSIPEVQTQKNGTMTACGIRCDFRIGGKGYQALKVGGMFRECIETHQYDDLSFLPKWLTPIAFKDDFIGCTEGEHRNDKLFRAIIPMKKEGLHNRTILKSLRLINSFCFEKSLPEDELLTISRDQSLNSAKDMCDVDDKYHTGNRFDHLELAKDMIADDSVKLYGGTLYTRDINTDEIHFGDAAVLREVCKRTNETSRHQRTEVLYDLYDFCQQEERPPFSSSKLIKFKNGIYDLNRKEFLNEFEAKGLWIPNVIPYDYQEGYTHPDVEKVLDTVSCGDQDVKNMIEEMIGSCLYRNNAVCNKIFLLTGTGANGKSTLLDALRLFLGDQNTSAVDMQDFKNVFSTSNLQGKLANIGDDIGADYISHSTSSKIKKIATGNIINAQRKNENAFEFIPYCTMIYSCNIIPRMKDDSYGNMRRFQIIPFGYEAMNDPNRDPEIYKRIQTEDAMRGWATVAMRGLYRLMENKFEYTTAKSSFDTKNEFETENDSVKYYLTDLTDEDIEGQKVTEMYNCYKTFCEINGTKYVNRVKFLRKVKDSRGFVSKRSYAMFKDEIKRFVKPDDTIPKGGDKDGK